jgi:hypothetical protein
MAKAMQAEKLPAPEHIEPDGDGGLSFSLGQATDRLEEMEFLHTGAVRGLVITKGRIIRVISIDDPIS